MAEERKKNRIAAFLRRKVIEPILDLLRQGVTPGKIAMSLAFGLGVGIFPVLGVSTIACTAIAIALRLNLPAIQIVNYLASPLQLALIVPFVRVGEFLLGVSPQPISIAEGFRLMQIGVLHAITVLWDAIVHAALGWIVLGPAIIFVLYRVFRPILIRAARLRAPARSAASAEGSTR